MERFSGRRLRAVLITLVCFGKAQAVTYRISWILAWNGALMRRILSIAIPNGIESGVFQLVKVALTSMAALFGTYQIAANGVAQSIWSLAALAGVAMGPVFITVIGQCVGARDLEAAAFVCAGDCAEHGGNWPGLGHGSRLDDSGGHFSLAGTDRKMAEFPSDIK